MTRINTAEYTLSIRSRNSEISPLGSRNWRKERRQLTGLFPCVDAAGSVCPGMIIASVFAVLDLQANAVYDIYYGQADGAFSFG